MRYRGQVRTDNRAIAFGPWFFCAFLPWLLRLEHHLLGRGTALLPLSDSCSCRLDSRMRIVPQKGLAIHYPQMNLTASGFLTLAMASSSTLLAISLRLCVGISAFRSAPRFPSKANSRERWHSEELEAGCRLWRGGDDSWWTSKEHSPPGRLSLSLTAAVHLRCLHAAVDNLADTTCLTIARADWFAGSQRPRSLSRFSDGLARYDASTVQLP